MSPPSLPRMARDRADAEATGLSPTAVTMSPTSSPARNAGLSATTLPTITPASSGTPKCVRSSGVNSESWTPRKAPPPCRPCSRAPASPSRFITRCTRRRTLSPTSPSPSTSSIRTTSWPSAPRILTFSSETHSLSSPRRTRTLPSSPTKIMRLTFSSQSSPSAQSTIFSIWILRTFFSSPSSATAGATTASASATANQTFVLDIVRSFRCSLPCSLRIPVGAPPARLCSENAPWQDSFPRRESPIRSPPSTPERSADPGAQPWPSNRRRAPPPRTGIPAGCAWAPP